MTRHTRGTISAVGKKRTAENDGPAERAATAEAKKKVTRTEVSAKTNAKSKISPLSNCDEAKTVIVGKRKYKEANE